MTASVLHYVPRWLEPSEQFVHAVVHATEHRAVVVAAELVDGTTFSASDLTNLGVLDRLPASIAGKLRTAALMWLAARRDVGLVHVHFGYRWHDVAGLVHRRSLPLVVSLHGHDAFAFADEYPEVYGDALARVDAVVVPSEFLAARAVEIGARPAAIHVIPAGVDLDRFAPSPVPPEPVALFVGRFAEKKGLDVLLAAWPTVRERVPDARLRLVGYGPLAPQVRAEEGIEVVGRRPHSEVAAEVRRARVVVSPSRTATDGDADTLVVVNLEAQACGRPVVTTRHGGIPEYVQDGHTALLVEEGDPTSLAEALVRVLSDQVLARSLGGAGPAWVEQFSVARAAARLDELYDSLMSP